MTQSEKTLPINSSSRIRYFIVEQESISLEDYLKNQINWTEEQLQFHLQLGSVYLNYKRVYKDILLKKEDYLRVHTDPRRFHRPPHFFTAPLYDDENYFIIDKPPFVSSHGTVDNIKENALAWWSEKIQQQLYITHRLDVATAGCLVYAKSTEAAKKFNQLISEKKIKKIYSALVEGQLEKKGLVQHWMEKSQWAPKTVRSENFENSLECRLYILTHKARTSDIHTSLLRTQLTIELETGRTHQIRVQLAKLGHPIVGDTMYGAKELSADETIQFGLASIRLSFECPFKKILIDVQRPEIQ